MKTKLMMIGALAATCAVHELVAMPTAEETRRAEPAVKKLLASEREALKAGKKTRSEVAVAAMKRAADAKTEAEKLLLMKGAFALYVQDGNLEKAAETLNVLKKTIPDLPQESVTNMIEAAHLGASKKEGCVRLYTLLDEAKAKNNGPAGSDVRMATVDGYTWSYRVRNGEATIVAEKEGKHSCAVSPAPTGDLKIPAALGGVKVTRIGTDAFRNCDELTSVTIPEGVTHIDTHALAYCGGLKSVTLPSSLRDIGYAAFGKDMELESVTIPNGVRSIAPDAFNGCVKVKSLVIPESVTHIGDRAFCAWHELESVAIPSGVANIGKGVFSDCNALKLINVDSGNQAFTAVDGVLYTKDRSELVMWANPRNAVVIPDGVTKIRGWAFAFGEGMTSVTIPESVTTIDDIVFIGCAGLKSVTIPSRVKSMGEHVFERCSELTEVKMLGERPEAPENLFPGCGKLKAIHVPANAKSWAGMKEWQGIPLVFDGEVSEAFSLNATPGSVTELDLGNVPPLQFVYCPAGKFSMGYKEQPAISKVKDVEITSPFWVSKTVIRADQLELLGLNSITNTETGDAVINDGSVVLEKLPSALKERFGKMLPPGYVFRLPTEAEFEYLQKAETNNKNAQTNIWGVERLYSGGYIGLLDKVPAYGRVDVVRRRNHRGVIMTDLVKVNYENQPGKDPVGWTDDPTWSVFRRGLARNCGGGKLVTAPGGGKYHYSFYFVVAPDIDKLNKFYWK